jgi:hypothetical protein
MASQNNRKLSNIGLERDNHLMETTEEAELSWRPAAQVCICRKAFSVIREAVVGVHKIHQFAAKCICEAVNGWSQSRFHLTPARQFLQVG